MVMYTGHVHTGPVRDRTRDHYRKVGIQRREREKRKDRNGVREREKGEIWRKEPTCIWPG